MVKEPWKDLSLGSENTIFMVYTNDYIVSRLNVDLGYQGRFWIHGMLPDM